MDLNLDIIGLIIGLTLTLFIYSYLFIGNKAPYRLAIHLLVGASAAYAAVIVIRQVILPLYDGITQNPTPAEAIYWLLPILLLLLLLLRRLRVVSWLGNNTMALLIGVGAAVAFTGALAGTLLPQLSAAGQPADGPAWRHLVIAALTAFTLLSFQFTTFRASATGIWERARWQTAIVWLGRAVLMITFGALFASILNTGFVLLADRINYFWSEITRLLLS